MTTPELTRRGALHGVLVFVAINCLLLVVNAWGYVSIAAGSGGLGALFLRVALVAQVATLALAVGGILAALTALAPPRFAAGPMAAAASLLFVGLQLFVLVDRKQYALFRFHLNGLALNVMLSRGGWESMHVSRSDFVVVFGGIALALAGEALLFRWLVRRGASIAPDARVGRRWLALIVPIALLGMTERATYAWADLQNVREVTRSARIIPLYQPFTIKRFAKKWLGIKVENDVRVASGKSGGLLKYPREPLRFHAPAPAPNIVWLTLDSWRADEMSTERTPAIAALAAKSSVFTHHLSAGNATRYGVFTMFYGIHGSYWQTVLGERKGPVLVSRLKELGYRTKILSSTSLTWPEFRRTAFVEIPDSVEDELPGPRTKDRDRQLVEHFEKFLDEPDAAKKPFFAWLFFDSSHAPYDLDETAKLPFADYAESMSYTHLESLRDDLPARTKMRHRYENAVAYLDGLCGRVIAGLEKRGLTGDTIVVITGDHGEEYYEHGYFGHNGAFTPEQIHVPMVVFDPSRPPAVIDRVTTHEDLVPTFMETLGVENPPADYTLGHPLFDPAPRRVVSCSWSECALVGSNGWIVFGTETWASAGADALGPDYKEVADPRAALSEKSGELSAVMQEMSAFLR